MITQSQKVRLGIFLIVSAILLAGSFVIVSAPKFLEKQDEYYIEYVDVSVGGLDAGTTVKYHGIRVGRVEDVYVDPGDITKIRVVVSLRKGTPIKADTEAVIASIGITGLKYIELTAGTTESDRVAPGGQIATGRSLFSSLSDQAEVMALQLETIFENVAELTDEEHRRAFVNTVESIGQMVAQGNALIAENREQVRVTAHNATVISESLIEVAANLNRIVEGKAVRETLAHIHAISGKLKSEVDSLHIKDTVSNLDRLITNADQTVSHIDLTILRSREDIMRSLADFQEIIQNLKEATTLIRQDPSILLRGSARAEIEE
ncbi:MAG: MlaD family protein [Candidatus Latescibacterota bacterium]